jgi:ribose-phosphate pyrophosphokinase
MAREMKVLCGSINPALGATICKALKIKPAAVNLGQFPGRETSVQICENVRGKDVFIIQSVCDSGDRRLSPNDALIELLFLIDAARRASASRITAVLPFFGYARQERKDKPRVPISAKVVADMITVAGANRVLTLDLHSNQIQGFFNIPVDHLYAITVFARRIKARAIPRLVVVSPDAGGVKMVRAYAKFLGAPLAIIDKRRLSGTRTEVLNVIGDVADMDAIMVDDLTATGSSIAKGATALLERGARSVKAVVVHPVMVEDQEEGISATRTIMESPLQEVLVSDSIPACDEITTSKIKVLSVAPLLARAIQRIHNDQSISVLFADTGVEG